jgi:hypothetical protein
LATSAQPPQDCTFLVTNDLTSSSFVMTMAEHALSDYVLLSLKAQPLTLGSTALDRLMLVADDEDAAMVYSDRYTMEHGERKAHPVIDYQEGSLRDDFDFGSVWLLRTSLLHKYATSDR